MRNILVVVLLAVLSAAGYFYYFGEPWPQWLRWPWKTEVAAQPTKDNAIAHLSSLVDAYIDAIFSPLDGVLPPTSFHELNKLRALLADGVATSTSTEQSKYKTALQLCDVLLVAIREREACNLRLASSRTRPYALGLSGNQVTEESQKRAFFEGAIALSWAQSARAQRERVRKLYQALRQQEQLAFSSAARQ